MVFPYWIFHFNTSLKKYLYHPCEQSLMVEDNCESGDDHDDSWRLFSKNEDDLIHNVVIQNVSHYL